MRRIPGGSLVIAWGPGAHTRGWTREEFATFWKGDKKQTPIKTFHDFCGGAEPGDEDAPFASPWFGSVVRAYLNGLLVVVTDPSFEDRQRRRVVEQAFRFVFPDWTIRQLQLGGAVPQGLVIDDDVYGVSGGRSNEHVVVESDAPTEAVVAALEEAAARMMRVDDDGHEEPADEWEGPMGPASYVSAIRFDDRGRPGFYIDCKGGIEPVVAARFRAILREELERHAIATAVVRVP